MLIVLMVLLLMTVMLVYGTRVSVFEQRMSANDEQQKRMFNLAEAGRSFVVAQLQRNDDILEDNDASGNPQWQACGTEPECTLVGNQGWTNTDVFIGTIEPTAATLFSDSQWSQGVNGGTRLETLDVRMVAANRNDGDFLNDRIFVFSEAVLDDGDGNQVARAAVSDVLAAYDGGGGSPEVPLIVHSGINVPGGGTFDIVANPNGGGEGVPVSVWSRVPVTPNGNWRTCEAYEFYRTIEPPAGVACTGNGNNNCNCEAGSELSDAKSRYSDIVDNDTSLPDDVFQAYFGVPKSEWQSVKAGMQNVNGCGSLGPTSEGNIWVTGECQVGSATSKTIGSPDKPVFLVVDGDFAANAKSVVFGVVFITDAPNPGAPTNLKMNGGAEVYGAVVVDHDIDNFNGNFAIVYNEEIINRATEQAELAPIPGGWSDTVCTWTATPAGLCT